MKSVPITKNFDHSRLGSYMGDAHFSDEAFKEINDLLSSGIVMDFAVSFIGDPDEKGVYHNAELIGVSMIPRKRNDGV